MIIKCKYMGGGLNTFHSNKTGQDYQRSLICVTVIGIDGTEEIGNAMLSFGYKLDSLPKFGDTIYLDVDSFNSRDGMAQFTFKGWRPVK